MRFAIPRMPKPLDLRAPVAALGAIVMVASLLTPPAEAATHGEWVLAADRPVPTGAEVVATYPVAGVKVVASPEEPDGAVPLATGLVAPADEAGGQAFRGGGEPELAHERLGVPEAWDAGYRGEGALVALVDTGVAPVDALEDAVVAEIDFTGEGGGDGFGHGTYMASVIAGRGELAPGIAPEAGIVSLKVAGDDGDTDLGTVLAALQWLHGPGRDLGIRVATVAVGVDPDTPAGEILDAAVEVLGAAGTLVVTAAGNDDEQRLSAPATSPGTVSVGALDGDEEANFSGRGVDRLGISQPDILAPGVGVAGHAPPDSLIVRSILAENGHSDRVAQGHVRGHGTSVAAALASGIAALASGANPDLDGPELAAVLGKDSGGVELEALATASAVEGLTSSRPQPETRPNDRSKPVHPHTPPAEIPLAPVAEWTAATWNGVQWVVADEDGSHDAGPGRGTPPPHAQSDTVRWNAAIGDGHSVVGEAQPTMVRWNAVRWNAVRWNTVKWNAVRWNAVRWNAVRWNAVRWNTVRWNTVRWNGEHWHTAGAD